MIIKTLAELREADGRTLAFNPMGLGPKMRAEDSAAYQQTEIAQLDLAPNVAEGTRQSFEHLRTVFAYGVLCYEIFTLVEDHALLVIEQALRDRFIEFHQGTVTFVEKNGTEHLEPATRYQQVNAIMRAKGKWRLRLPNGQPMDFKGGMLAGLWDWARNVGLLRGQHNRGIEKALSHLRDFVAHPNGYHLDGPDSATRTLSDLAEIINQLWGVPTPGGRLYPAPLHREVIVLMWNASCTEQRVMSAEALLDTGGFPDEPWTCVVLRAFFRPLELLTDPGLHYYDSWFEVTRYPADLLWGPGTIADAAAWYAEHQPAADECDYLDRIFLIRHDGPDLYLPMRPSVSAALPEEERGGVWHAVKADYPGDAYFHVRTLVEGSGCAENEPCRQCAAESLACGPHADVLADIGYQPESSAGLPAEVTTPRSNPRSHETNSSTPGTA